MLLAQNPNGSVLKLVANAWAGFGAAFGPVILLALMWPRMTRGGALAGMVTGAVVVIVWIQAGWSATLDELVPGFAAAMAAIVVVSLLTKTPAERADAATVQGIVLVTLRPEGRRGGEECCRTVKSRWA